MLDKQRIEKKELLSCRYFSAFERAHANPLKIEKIRGIKTG